MPLSFNRKVCLWYMIALRLFEHSTDIVFVKIPKLKFLENGIYLQFQDVAGISTASRLKVVGATIFDHDEGQTVFENVWQPTTFSCNKRSSWFAEVPGLLLSQVSLPALLSQKHTVKR